MLLNSFLEIVFCDLELCTNSLQYSHMYLLLTNCDQFINPLKRSDVRRLHFQVLSAIQV